MKPMEKNLTDLSGNLVAIAEDEDEEGGAGDAQETEEQVQKKKNKKQKHDEEIILASGQTKKDVELLSNCRIQLY